MLQIISYLRNTRIRLSPRWPLLPLFKAYYHTSIWLAVFLLKRISGVRAVYITGSFARDGVIYGLSDIDLTVFFHNNGKEGNYNRIYVVLRAIGLLFPMFGGVAEKGIFPLETFLNDWRNSRSLQYLFDQGLHPHRLLWGRDILGELQPQMQGGYSPYSVFAYRFDYWMGVLIQTIPREIKRKGIPSYCLYKAFRDIFLIYLKVNEPGYSSCRETDLFKDGMSAADGDLSEREKSLIASLIEARNNIFLDWKEDVDETFGLLRKMIGLCLQSMKNGLEQAQCETYEETKRPGSLDQYAVVEFAQALEQEIAEISSRLDCTLSRYSHSYIPFPCNLQRDHLKVGLPLLIITTQREMTFGELLWLRRLIEKHLKSKLIVLIRDNDEYYTRGYFDVPQSGENGALITGLFEPHTYYLQNGSCVPRDLSVCAMQWQQCLIIDLARTQAQLSRRALMVHSPGEFYKFVFSAMQKLVFARAMDERQLYLPLCPAELCRHLADETTVEPRFFEKLLGMFEAGVQVDPVAHAHFFSAAHSFVNSLFACHAEGKPLQGIKLDGDWTGDHDKSLTISVIVATRTREHDLKNCLASLVELDRMPDEVVLVDNGSTDNTRELALSFEKYFPLTYVYTEKYGMAAVRNEGVKAATMDILAFIDDDAIADRRWLNYVEKTFILGDDIGIVGGRIGTMKKERNDLTYEYSRMVDMIGEIVLEEQE